MTIWTIQTVEAWRRFEKNGVLRADMRRITDKHHAFAYKWMVGQMELRLGFRPSRYAAPLWGWFQWRNARRKKPDLRAVRHNAAKGLRLVRIAFDIDGQKTLLSEFELWHYVLNCWYLPASRADYDSFERKLAQRGLDHHGEAFLSHEDFRDKITKSWDRIFDLDWADEYVAMPKKEKQIQTCFWELRKEQVKEITFFTGSYRE